MTLRMQKSQVLARLAIGEKGTSKNGKLIPQKLDYFIITHPFDKAKNIAPKHASMMKWLAEKSGTDKPKHIDVVLVDHHPDEVFYTNYMNYKTNKCDCIGDGETTAQRRNKDGGWDTVCCDYKNCEHRWNNGLNTCKPTGKLHFIIPEAPISGGIMRYVNHSQIGIGRLNAALRQMYQFRKTLKGLKIRLTVKTVSVVVAGKDTNVYIVEASIPIALEKLALGEATHPLFSYNDALNESISLGLMPDQTRMDELRDSDDTDEEFQQQLASQKTQEADEPKPPAPQEPPMVEPPTAQEQHHTQRLDVTLPPAAPLSYNEDDDPGF